MDYDFDDEDYEERKYNKLYTALLSLVPGAGHMYLGLMKKGLQFMFMFFSIVMITDLIYSARSFTILNIVVWFYAFFDAYHTRKKLELGKKVDEDLFHELKLSSAKPKYVGIGLIIVGGIVLVQQVVLEVLALGIIVIPPYMKIAIINSIFPILLVGMGIFILKGSAHKNVKPKEDFGFDDFDNDDFDDFNDNGN